MVRYLEERAREIKLERGRAKFPDSEATPTEITAMRGLMGKLNWASREGMPNGSGDASILSATLPKPKVKDLQEANAALRRLMEARVVISIKSIHCSRSSSRARNGYPIETIDASCCTFLALIGPHYLL